MLRREIHWKDLTNQEKAERQQRRLGDNRGDYRDGSNDSDSK